MKDHRLIDERSLAFGRAVVARLEAHPELIDFAKGNLTRWLTTCSPGSRSTLLEWLATLEGPLDGVITLLTSRDQRAIRLRQSSPFAGVLSEDERNAILRKFEAIDAASS